MITKLVYRVQVSAVDLQRYKGRKSSGVPTDGYYGSASVLSRPRRPEPADALAAVELRCWECRAMSDISIPAFGRGMYHEIDRPYSGWLRVKSVVEKGLLQQDREGAFHVRFETQTMA